MADVAAREYFQHERWRDVYFQCFFLFSCVFRLINHSGWKESTSAIFLFHYSSSISRLPTATTTATTKKRTRNIPFSFSVPTFFDSHSSHSFDHINLKKILKGSSPFASPKEITFNHCYLSFSSNKFKR